MMAESMKLALRRTKDGSAYALHDAETGEILPAQQSLQIERDDG